MTPLNCKLHAWHIMEDRYVYTEEMNNSIF